MGAIAFEKNDCNFPQRSDDNRDESKNNHSKSHDDFERDEAVTSNPKKNQATTSGATATRSSGGTAS